METVDDPKLSSRIRHAFFGLAVCDALGAPLEFKPRRWNPNKYTTDMLPNPNFDLPEGHFTDDTSMALCLAQSLIDAGGKDDPVDQAKRYVRWMDDGYMSSVSGYAFDIGIQTRLALQYWRKQPEISTLEFVQKKFNEERRCGNGSLMRVLPCALVARSEAEAVDLSRRSSEVTHPHQRCSDACSLYSSLVYHALRGSSKTKLLQHLRENLKSDAIDPDIHLRLIEYEEVLDFKKKPRSEISSSGYVLDSLEAALWAFFTTDKFEEGAIEVVNLGDDADTVGAIYGGLAGAFYGNESCIPDRWLSKMKQIKLVEQAADGIWQIVSRLTVDQ